MSNGPLPSRGPDGEHWLPVGTTVEYLLARTPCCAACNALALAVCRWVLFHEYARATRVPRPRRGQAELAAYAGGGNGGTIDE